MFFVINVMLSCPLIQCEFEQMFVARKHNLVKHSSSSVLHSQQITVVGL